MSAYYNEIDPYAAQWLRNLIDTGHIAPGIVDERSIEDVKPEYLKQFTQCHFFAGIGVWSYALRSAGWPDSRPVWTGSCPCQPFSTAGKGDGFADERHLWPAFNHLISECKPAIVIGEQVASKAVDPWIDLVQTDMEALGYAFGAVAFPSASVGAPHIRDRTYWVGNNNNKGLEGFGLRHQTEIGRVAAVRSVAEASESGGLDDTQSVRPGFLNTENVRAPNAQVNIFANAGDSESDQPQWKRSTVASTGPTNGFWRNVDWLFCRDGKWRPVEPGTFPLAHGAASRVGRLRAYGNAINAIQAKTFIECLI